MIFKNFLTHISESGIESQISHTWISLSRGKLDLHRINTRRRQSHPAPVQIQVRCRKTQGAAPFKTWGYHAGDAVNPAQHLIGKSQFAGLDQTPDSRTADH